ncbi:MAG: flavodoxin-dependent (E)-4-hydroxy-3-methylbut-2-enyl-diphosphate synthase [Coriobacteriales bacterium]
MQSDQSRAEGTAARERTRRLDVGGVSLGGGAPVVVQSMTNAPMVDEGEGPHLDAAANLAQIERLSEAGCELVRVAIPNRASLDYFGQVVEESPLPVIADVHFDHEIAIGAAKRGAAALRINPGNIGSIERVDAVIDAAGQAGIPIRIGVNAGSLEDALAARDDLTQAEKLAESACGFVAHFEERGFTDVVVSAKAHDVPVTVAAYEELSARIPDVPLHIGITEAGGVQQGTIKSAAGLGILLHEGIGDTLRVSLTADPVEEIAVAYGILAAVDVRRVKPELISCPTCSRCQVDLIPIADEVARRLSDVNKPLKVAVMGCVVNGPGEARDADVGVACGRGEGLLFSHGKRLEKVPAERIVDALFELIERA